MQRSHILSWVHSTLLFAKNVEKDRKHLCDFTIKWLDILRLLSTSREASMCYKQLALAAEAGGLFSLSLHMASAQRSANWWHCPTQSTVGWLLSTLHWVIIAHSVARVVGYKRSQQESVDVSQYKWVIIHREWPRASASAKSRRRHVANFLLLFCLQTTKWAETRG